jgi:U3 small nucleolar RNA-associated protein 10
VSTLQGLLKTIPAFWGSAELSQIVLLYMDQQSSASKANASGISALAKSLAKKLPPKVLIPALMEMWGPLQGSKNIVSSNEQVHVLDPTHNLVSNIRIF